ncbi:MAG: hypothetical protein WC882_01175 [Candidatus Gracilibacteria bacterium]
MKLREIVPLLGLVAGCAHDPQHSLEALGKGKNPRVDVAVFDPELGRAMRIAEQGIAAINADPENIRIERLNGSYPDDFMPHSDRGIYYALEAYKGITPDVSLKIEPRSPITFVSSSSFRGEPRITKRIEIQSDRWSPKSGAQGKTSLITTPPRTTIESGKIDYMEGTFTHTTLCDTEPGDIRFTYFSVLLEHHTTGGGEKDTNQAEQVEVERVEVECNEPPKGPYISTYIVRLGEGEWIMTEPDVVMYPVATAKWEDGDPAYEGVYALAKGEKFDFKTATMDDNSDPDKAKHFYANKEKDVGGFAHEIEWKILDLIDSIQTKENNSSSPAKVVSEGSATAKPQKETPSASQPVQPSDSAIVAKSLHPQARRSKPQTAPKVAPPPVPRKTEDDADSQPLKVVPGGEIGIWSRRVQSLIPTPTDQIDDEAWAKAEALETSLKAIIAKYPGCNHTVRVGPDRNKTGLFMRVRVMDELGNSIMLGIQEGGQGNAYMFWEESIRGNPQRGKLDPMPMDRAISWMQEQIEFQSKESKHQLSSLIMNLPVISKPHLTPTSSSVTTTPSPSPLKIHPVKSKPSVVQKSHPLVPVPATSKQVKEESPEDIKVSPAWQRSEALVASLSNVAKEQGCADRVNVSSSREGIGVSTKIVFPLFGENRDFVFIKISEEEAEAKPGKGLVLSVYVQESIRGEQQEFSTTLMNIDSVKNWAGKVIASQCGPSGYHSMAKSMQ